MRVTAREVIAEKKKATTFVFDLMREIRRSLGPRYEWVDSNFTAYGAEAVVRDTGQWPMEYRIDIRPVPRPQDVTLQ